MLAETSKAGGGHDKQPNFIWYLNFRKSFFASHNADVLLEYVKSRKSAPISSGELMF